MDCSLQGSSARGILQARILEWVSVLSSWVLLDPGIELAFLMSPVLAGRFFITSATSENWTDLGSNLLSISLLPRGQIAWICALALTP